MNHQICILDAQGVCKAEKSGQEEVILTWKGSYEPGDVILFRVGAAGHYRIRVDDCLDEAMVYITQDALRYPVLFEEKKEAHNPADQHDAAGCYPHASANVETRGESVFAARNAIDGILAVSSHGRWPYASWGINMQEDAEFTLDFGRPVDFDTIVLYTRADFPHDNWWVRGTFTFSDGTQEEVEMTKSEGPQKFSITRAGICWLKLSHLIKADDPSPFPALTQIEVYGTDTER